MRPIYRRNVAVSDQQAARELYDALDRLMFDTPPADHEFSPEGRAKLLLSRHARYRDKSLDATPKNPVDDGREGVA